MSDFQPHPCAPAPQQQPGPYSVPPNESGVIWLAYALHFCAFFTGGVSCVVGLIINYIKRHDQNLLMSSHMQWQIDTFWRALAGCVLLGFVFMLLMITVVGVIFAYPLIVVLGIWYAYRLIKGMLALNARKPVY